MWWLLGTMCFVHIFGNTFCLLQKKPMNPEVHMNISQIISHWGYPNEEYEVVTEDGYILPVNRIPYGKNDSCDLAQKPVVYLQHGLLSTGGMWIANLPNNSLGFVLADAGFDVWIGNSRGNTWARKHLYLDTDSKEFWAFSYDEMIKYDLPATINFIVKKTGEKQIYYVGHSQGTLLAFGAFATNPQLALKIKIYFAMGPFAALKHSSGSSVPMYFEPTLFKVLFGEKEFLLATYFNYIGQNLCDYEILDTGCKYLLSWEYGYNPNNLNEAVRTGVFQAYDWGSPSLNILHYNQSTPPLYNVEDMKVPTAMWSGGRDTMATPRDVKDLEPKISNLIYNKKIDTYNHIDFVLGLDAYYKVYSELIRIINEAE